MNIVKQIPIANYEYEAIYPSFKAGTDEKRITSDIMHRFLERAIALAPPTTGPLKVADIGCGPCDTILNYLEGVRCDRGFVIRATDIGAEYTGPDGEARPMLAEARRAGRIPLADFSVHGGDSFAGGLADILSVPGDAARTSFALAFVSHLLYHAPNEAGVETLIGDVIDNLLAASGLAILCHAAAPPETFSWLRARFGRHSTTLDQSDTPAVNVGDSTGIVSRYCARRGLPLVELEFIARMYLPDLSDQDWRDFAHPERYAELVRRAPSAAENLRRILFVTERAPMEFAADKSETGLEAYLAAAREVAERNAGSIPLAERIQIAPRAGVAARFVEDLRKAAEAAMPAK